MSLGAVILSDFSSFRVPASSFWGTVLLKIKRRLRYIGTIKTKMSDVGFIILASRKLLETQLTHHFSSNDSHAFQRPLTVTDLSITQSASYLRQFFKCKVTTMHATMTFNIY
jgi:hypothetical protein